MASVSISGGGIVVSSPVYSGSIPLSLPGVPGVSIGVDSTNGVGVLTVGAPYTEVIVAVKPSAPAGQIILGGVETVYAGNGGITLGGLTSTVPGFPGSLTQPIGVDTTGGVDVVTVAGGSLVAVNPTSQAAEVIVGGMETVYAGNGNVVLGGATGAIPGLDNPIPYVGVDTAGGVTAVTFNNGAGVSGVVAANPTQPAAELALGGVETVYANGNGTLYLGGVTDSVPGVPSIPSSPFGGQGADTISMGTGADTVVEAGRATVASLGAVSQSALSNVDSISGAHNAFGAASSVDPLNATLGHDALSAISTSSLLGFGADSTASAHLASGFVSGNSDLAQAATLVPDSTHTDGSFGHSLVSMDGGLTTIELKGISHIGK